MTPPIDILDVAERIYSWAWWRYRMLMQWRGRDWNGKKKRGLRTQARVALMLAEKDLAAVERLVRELG